MPNVGTKAPPFKPIGNTPGVTLLVESTPPFVLQKDLATANTNTTNPWTLANGTGTGHANINIVPVPTGANSLLVWAAWIGSDPASDPTVAFYGRLQNNDGHDGILDASNVSSSFVSSVGTPAGSWWIKLYQESTSTSSFTFTTTTGGELTDGTIKCSAHTSVNVVGVDRVLAVVTTAAGAGATNITLMGSFVR